MKRILSIVLTMFMLVGVLSAAPSTAGAESNHITVYFENNWLWSDVFYHTRGSSYLPDTVWGKGEVTYVGLSVNGNEVYKATVGIDAIADVCPDYMTPEEDPTPVPSLQTATHSTLLTMQITSQGFMHTLLKQHSTDLVDNP